jgi:CheY-like chemotaxis protein/anti-sigma regulatory factor (Ser/Thr protein kinase)
MVTPQAEIRNIELLERGSREHIVHADRQRIKQVLLNLLANAIKYGHDGGRVAVVTTVLGDQRIRLAVSDDGPGIHPDLIRRLFKPFERLGADQSEVEGTGLGLALSAGLVEAMGGVIGVESTRGEGSTFWLELAAAEAPPDPEPEGPEQGARSLPVQDLEGSVLYIEDNLPNVRLMERILQRRPGIDLFVATDGQTGLDLAVRHQPGLILIDLHLPDIPGREVLSRLQSDPRTFGIPVVVVSADASPGQIRRLREAGAHEFLTKPVDLDQILRLLDEVFGSSIG